MTTRIVYPEQDATFIIRVSTSIKSWYAELANRTPDRNMSDFARDALRRYMLEQGGVEWVEKERIERVSEDTVAIEPEEKQAAYDFSGMPDLDLVEMQRQIRESGKDEGFLNAILVELGKRDRARVEPAPATPEETAADFSRQMKNLAAALLPEEARDYPPIAPLEQDSD